MDNSRGIYLLGRYYHRQLSAGETAELAALMESTDEETSIELLNIFMEQQEMVEADASREQLQPLISRILEVDREIVHKKVRHLRKWTWVAAASVLLLLAAGAFFWKKSVPELDIVESASAKDIPAGKNGAILTLADGSQVSLDTFKNATVALQDGVTAKVINGALVYEGSGNVVGFNTMTTPNGRHFQLMLPDGTQVWLNAASSIRYPTAFVGDQRLVEVTGEVYFEVAKNAKMPFRLNINDKAAIEVLGTRFNVNAYVDERSINTTLLEGSVKISAEQATSSVILKPGEQAEFDGTIKVNRNVDIEKVMAWKNGRINFDGATFDEIMRQVERWYDIKVKYENDKVPSMQLAGEMTRDVPLDGLLKNLKEFGVKYKMEGRVLTILP